MINSLSTSFFWSAVERFSVQFFQFAIGIVLARLVSPSEYGVLSLILVINAILQTFVDSGFSKERLFNTDMLITAKLGKFKVNRCH